MHATKDILGTADYETHHKFYFSLVIGSSISVITTMILIDLSFVFKYLQIIFNTYTRIPFLILTLTNNIYQVYAHIFTGTKFAGYYGIVPLGSKDNQTLTVFTISNVFDILGWMSIFIYYGYAHPFLAILAAAHYGSGIVSIFFNKTFQAYFIGNNSKKNNSDTFGYLYWRIFRVSFVLTDAIARGYVSYFIFLDV